MQKGAIYLEQDYIANRREYILRARNSFSESRKDTDEELINTGKAAIWKVKWLLCIFLFVVIWIAPETLLKVIKYTLQGSITTQEAIQLFFFFYPIFFF